MKLTKQTLKQLINEVLKEELQPYEGADPRSLFGEITRDYDFDVISDDGESGYAETPRKEYVIKYFNYPVFKQFELFHNGDEVVIMTTNDSGKQQSQKLKRILKHIESHKKQMNEEIIPNEQMTARGLFREIVRDYAFFATSDDGQSGYAETPKKELVIKYSSYEEFEEFELFKNGDEVAIFTSTDSGKQKEYQLKKILKYIKPHKKQMNESTNEPSIPFELVGASPKEIASYIQKNYTMNVEQDNSDDYLVLVSPTNDRRLVAVDKFLYLVHRKKQGGVSGKVLVDLTKNSNEVIEKRINKILDLLEPYKK